MDQIAEAVKTVTMMSPPMLVIVGAFMLNFLLKPFLPEKYLAPIATLGGGLISPHLFSHETLAYPVPSPTVALTLIGCAMGFIGSVFHRRIDRWIRTKLMGTNGNGNGNGDTRFLTRSGAAPEQPVPPATSDSDRKSGG